tara:strand:+ start:780 stop:2285 length:1506 start_codon:yes stop_codon:yes gene_type:complete
MLWQDKGWLLACVSQVCLWSCSQSPEPALFTLHNQTFAATASDVSAEFRGIPMALGDLVGDDLQDLVVGNRNGGLWVFENTGDLEFLDVTADFDFPFRSGVVAVAVADMVGDERRELLVALKNELFILSSDRPARIMARTPLMALAEQLLPMDVDGDGQLELLVLQRSTTEVESLFEVVGAELVPSTTHSLSLAGRPWSATLWDANGDGLSDLHVANDTLAADYGDGEPVGAIDEPPDAFFLGDATFGFSMQPNAAGLDTPRSSMGGRLLDIGEERTLLLVPDLGRNKLFEWQNSGFEQVKGLGLDVALYDREPCDSESRLACLILSWSTASADFDLDGAQELMVGNAFSGLVLPTVLWYEWKSSSKRFARRSGELGLEAQGLLTSDLDRDGDIDLLVAGREGRVVLAENLHQGVTCPRQLRLLGTSSNSEGRGAIVTAHYQNVATQRHRIGAGGTAFVNDGVEVHFGRCDLERLEVLWPSGRRSSLDAPANGMIILTEPE